MADGPAPGSARPGEVSSPGLRAYLLYCAALLCGVLSTAVMFFFYVALRMGTEVPNWARSWLGFDVIDLGTPWQWTFNILLWGLPGLIVARWILARNNGRRPAWTRLLVAYGAFGLLLYLAGLAAYRTDLPRLAIGGACGLFLLTIGYRLTCRYVVQPAR